MKLVILFILCAFVIADNELTEISSPAINIGNVKIELAHTDIYADNEYVAINTGFEVSKPVGHGTLYAQGDIAYGHVFGHNGKADYGGQVGYRMPF